ncbi:isoprenylcysteine carboxylmethyltransferase family protein [uncultured Methanocorpusculum sp.]|nr:isoprenylcysteine carboxylmethyltransferase family protein [uncultured Methanocorpusculum sp.]
MDEKHLRRKTYLNAAGFFVFFWLILFVPAWTLDFWQGWVYWSIFLAAEVFIILYFLKKDPELIRSRLRIGPSAEPERSQKIIQTFGGISYLLVLVIAGLDHRFGWSSVSPYLAIAGDILILAAFYVVYLTFRENHFTAAIVEVQNGQTVISTGPYAWVRHPMYAGTSLLVLASPFALGSLWALIPAFLVIAGIVLRLLEEEKFLGVNLSGYLEYCTKTRFRLIPFVW